MDNARGPRLAIGSLALLCAVIAGCSTQGPSGAAKDERVSKTKDSEVVCPSCHEVAGGETGDFGAGTVACGYSEREVDIEQAEALGYPAKAYARAAHASIDMPMTWMPQDSKGGGPASGYEAHTRVFVSLSIDSFMYDELDIDGCDRMFPEPDANATCRSNTAAKDCASSDFIVVHGHGEVHTLDGAVMATMPPQILQIVLPGYDAVSLDAQVGLHDVRGTLRLDPAIPEPHFGFLYLSIEYTPSAQLRYGVLDMTVFFDDLQLDGGGGYRPPNHTDYTPLRGVWGTLPDDDSAQVGREGDAGTQ